MRRHTRIDFFQLFLQKSSGIPAVHIKALFSVSSSSLTVCPYQGPVFCLCLFSSCLSISRPCFLSLPLLSLSVHIKALFSVSSSSSSLPVCPYQGPLFCLFLLSPCLSISRPCFLSLSLPPLSLSVHIKALFSVSSSSLPVCPYQGPVFCLFLFLLSPCLSISRPCFLSLPLPPLSLSVHIKALFSVSSSSSSLPVCPYQGPVFCLFLFSPCLSISRPCFLSLPLPPLSLSVHIKALFSVSSSSSSLPVCPYQGPVFCLFLFLLSPCLSISRPCFLSLPLPPLSLSVHIKALFPVSSLPVCPYQGPVFCLFLFLLSPCLSISRPCFLSLSLALLSLSVHIKALFSVSSSSLPVCPYQGPVFCLFLFSPCLSISKPCFLSLPLNPLSLSVHIKALFSVSSSSLPVCPYQSPVSCLCLFSPCLSISRPCFLSLLSLSVHIKALFSVSYSLLFHTLECLSVLTFSFYI